MLSHNTNGGNIMKRNKEVIQTSPDKTLWVQLKSRIPAPLKEKMKAEAATLGEFLEDYLLQLYDMRHESYLKLLAQKELREKKKENKRT